MKKNLIFLLFFRLLSHLNGYIYDCDKINDSIDQSTRLRFLNTSFIINNFNSFSEINIECSAIFEHIDYIEITPKKALILDSTLNLNGLHLYKSPIFYYFSNLKGINVNLDLINSIPTSSEKIINLQIIIQYGIFDFYFTNTKILENEAECNSYRVQDKNFLTNLNKLRLANAIFSSKVCPMLFMSSKFQTLSLATITNSFINKNQLFFMSINKTNSKLIKFDIEALEIFIYYEILNKDLLNEHLFKNVRTIRIDSANLYDVDHDLFINNHDLQTIQWFIQNIRQFFCITQNKWLNSIKNSNLISRRIVYVNFYEYQPEFNIYEKYKYPDEDFCLFIDFENSIYAIIDPGEKINCTCTVIWILKNTKLLFQVTPTHDYSPYFGSQIPLLYCLYEKNYNDLFNKCDFDAKIKHCQTSEFPKKYKSESIFTLNTQLDLIYLLKFFQYILYVYLNQIFSFIGILTNTFVIVVVLNIKNIKKDKTNEAKKKKEKMFNYILIHSVFNVFYCFLMAFKPITLCLFFTPSLFCSRIAIEIETQWFKIIFIEFFGNIAKICCNVSYAAISISRIILTGTKKNKGCMKKFDFMNIKFFFVVLVVLSAVFSIFKIFQFSLNRFNLMNNYYTYYFSVTLSKRNDFYCISHDNDFWYCKFWDTWMIVNNVINDILFFIISIIFDIIVLKNISSMINNKKKMVENFKEEEEEKKRKRILKMIIINGIIFTLSHLPEFILSIFWLLFQNSNLIFTFDVSNLNEFGQFFIYLTIISQLSINIHFNSLFKESFYNLILKFKKKCSNPIK